MSVNASVVLEWPGGEHKFALRCGEIEILETEARNGRGGNGIGLGSIWTRVMGGEWFISDINSIIRLGLIGGGMGEVEARRMVRDYVENKPISDLSNLGPNCPLGLARAVLAAAIIGVEDTVADEEQNEEEASGEVPAPE